MTKSIYILILLNLFTGIPLLALSDSIGTLAIAFTGIRTNEGQIAININTPAENFPKEPGLEMQFKKDQMQDGTLIVEIDSLTYGLYAISVLDDLNGDLGMDMFLGFPKEGYGFSLNPEFKLRAPKFSDCAFEFNQPNQKITIQLQYPRKKK